MGESLGAAPQSGGGGGETGVGQAPWWPRLADTANERVPGRVAEHMRLREMALAPPGPLPPGQAPQVRSGQRWKSLRRRQGEPPAPAPPVRDHSPAAQPGLRVRGMQRDPFQLCLSPPSAGVLFPAGRTLGTTPADLSPGGGRCPEAQGFRVPLLPAMDDQASVHSQPHQRPQCCNVDAGPRQ